LGWLENWRTHPDQSQIFLTTLKGIRTDYTALRDKRVYRDEWDRLNADWMRLETKINRGYARPARIDEPGTGTGLSHCKEESTMEESAGVCLQ